MAQNSGRQQWGFEELDGKLKGIMAEIYRVSYDVGKEYSENGNLLPSLQAGANIGGFIKGE